MLIDANIFLEVLLGQKNAEKCRLFLGDIASGKKQGILSTFSVDSIVLSMLKNGVDKEEVKLFLNNLLKYKGMQFYQPKIRDRINCFSLIEIYGLDYEDAIVLQSAISSDSKEILSFDTDFNKVKEIKRIEP